MFSIVVLMSMLRFCYDFLDWLAWQQPTSMPKHPHISAFDNGPERDLCSALFMTSI